MAFSYVERYISGQNMGQSKHRHAKDVPRRSPRQTAHNATFSFWLHPRIRWTSPTSEPGSERPALGPRSCAYRWRSRRCWSAKYRVRGLLWDTDSERIWGCEGRQREATGWNTTRSFRLIFRGLQKVMCNHIMLYYARARQTII